jgi:hypothetical protein
MSSSPMSTGWGGIANNTQTDYWYQFSSAHPGVVLFAMGDGAVRSFRKPTTWPLIVWASATQDGVVYDQGSVMN